MYYVKTRLVGVLKVGKYKIVLIEFIFSPKIGNKLA